MYVLYVYMCGEHYHRGQLVHQALQELHSVLLEKGFFNQRNLPLGPLGIQTRQLKAMIREEKSRVHTYIHIYIHTHAYICTYIHDRHLNIHKCEYIHSYKLNSQMYNMYLKMHTYSTFKQCTRVLTVARILTKVALSTEQALKA